MHRNEFSFFADFFVRNFETREEYGFFQHPSVEGSVNSIEQKTQKNLSLLLN
jgi:hypothetical protein